MNSDLPNDRLTIARLYGAVALTAMACRVRNVRITLSPPRTTPMGFVVADTPTGANDVITRIMLDLAVPEARRIFTGAEQGVPSTVTSLLEQMSEGDGDGPDPSTTLQQCRSQVAQLIAGNRSTVELLGEVLVREGVLEGSTILQIVGDSLTVPGVTP